MANLYDLTENMRQLQEFLEEADELPEDMWEAADMIKGAYEDKMAGYAKVMKNMIAERDALLAEKVRLEKKADRLDNAITWLKANVLRSMKTLGVTRVDTTIGSWRTRKNPYKLVVDDPAKLPDGWWIQQEPKLDKAALRHYLLETGEVIEGAHLEQDEGVSLR